MFFRLRVLKIGNALDEPGTVNWDLALCLLLAWIICYLCVFKGVKSTGKVRNLQIFPFFTVSLFSLSKLHSKGACWARNQYENDERDWEETRQ